MWASARDILPTGAWTASLLIRTAARLWLPVRTALTSMASNSSPDSTATSKTLPAVVADIPDLR